jgi:uncharacterized protein (DUF433 family)
VEEDRNTRHEWRYVRSSRAVSLFKKWLKSLEPGWVPVGRRYILGTTDGSTVTCSDRPLHRQNKHFFATGVPVLVELYFSLNDSVSNEYIEQRNGGYYITGTRISLDSVIYSFKRGNLPDAIHAEYPLLKPSQIYGAIAFYLDHQADMEEYLALGEREFEESGVPIEKADPALWEKLERARANIGEPR